MHKRWGKEIVPHESAKVNISALSPSSVERMSRGRVIPMLHLQRD